VIEIGFFGFSFAWENFDYEKASGIKNTENSIESKIMRLVWSGHFSNNFVNISED
jgi:hypothetical protein